MSHHSDVVLWYHYPNSISQSSNEFNTYAVLTMRSFTTILSRLDWVFPSGDRRSPLVVVKAPFYSGLDCRIMCDSGIYAVSELRSAFLRSRDKHKAISLLFRRPLLITHHTHVWVQWRSAARYMQWDEFPNFPSAITAKWKECAKRDFYEAETQIPLVQQTLSLSTMWLKAWDFNNLAIKWRNSYSCRNLSQLSSRTM